MRYLIVYKWLWSDEIYNHFHTGGLKLDLQEVENEIRISSDEHEEDLIYINIIQLNQICR